MRLMDYSIPLTPLTAWRGWKNNAPGQHPFIGDVYSALTLQQPTGPDGGQELST